MAEMTGGAFHSLNQPPPLFHSLSIQEHAAEITPGDTVLREGNSHSVLENVQSMWSSFLLETASREGSKAAGCGVQGLEGGHQTLSSHFSSPMGHRHVQS